jgi:N-acetyl-gamma-glutamylphosphate reductase
MKLIIAGASGYVATEVIRRSLSLPQITSVIAVARRSVSAPDNLYPEADISKLHSAVIKEYDEYPEDVKKQFADADACIWYFYSASHP